MRMLEYLNGKTFLNQQIQFHKYFRFDLGDYESHSRLKMMTDINDIKKILYMKNNQILINVSLKKKKKLL